MEQIVPVACLKIQRKLADSNAQLGRPMINKRAVRQMAEPEPMGLVRAFHPACWLCHIRRSSTQ
jgi:hypothetical protein